MLKNDIITTQERFIFTYAQRLPQPKPHLWNSLGFCITFFDDLTMSSTFMEMKCDLATEAFFEKKVSLTFFSPTLLCSLELILVNKI